MSGGNSAERTSRNLQSTHPRWAKENGFRESYVMTGSENIAACRCYEKAGMEHRQLENSKVVYGYT